jgi:hypothetical protein
MANFCAHKKHFCFAANKKTLPAFGRGGFGVPGAIRTRGLSLRRRKKVTLDDRKMQYFCGL